MIKLSVYIAVIMLCCSAAYSVTLTFDDIPSGTVLGDSYAYNNRVCFMEYFQATDHTSCTWGAPHSGNNVLSLSGNILVNPLISFGRYTGTYAQPDSIQSVGAYFSTQLGVMVKITAYYDDYFSHTIVPITNVVIGDANDSWNNRYVEISSPGVVFNHLEFEGVNSTSDLLGFCADDMTITPVPEPSSILALIGGIAGIGGFALRRRRN
jgi:hypothetical protein